MISEEITRKLILSFGLSNLEIDNLTNTKAISYIKFYHEKKYGKSSVLFRGFSTADTNELAQIATKNSLSVSSRISPNLTFFCTDKVADLNLIETAKSNGTRVLRRDEFNLIFAGDENVYDLQDNEFLYDLSVPVELRIAKPLSNFDYNFQVNSFSSESDLSYELNLFKMTCSCPDFKKMERAQFSNGDLRRLCKHLMSEYKSRFGIYGQSKLNNFILDNGYSLKKNFKDFTIDKTNQKVILNYDNSHDWWSVFIENKKGEYQRYGYSPTQKGFAYNDKPIGIVGPLRTKLDHIYVNLSASKTRTSGQNKDWPKQTTSSQGCANVLVFVILIVLLLTILS